MQVFRDTDAIGEKRVVVHTGDLEQEKRGEEKKDGGKRKVFDDIALKYLYICPENSRTMTDPLAPRPVGITMGFPPLNDVANIYLSEVIICML